jgi:hypothetical protein
MSQFLEAELIRLADLRLSILQFLICSPGYASNIRLMRELLSLVGHKSSHENLVHELNWLCDRGCISITYHDDLIVIDLLKRGEDVAKGLINIEGVALPMAK